MYVNNGKASTCYTEREVKEGGVIIFVFARGEMEPKSDDNNRSKVFCAYSNFTQLTGRRALKCRGGFIESGDYFRDKNLKL
jgi:hypothetical protein